MRTKTPASRSTINASTGGMGREDELSINEQRKNITWTEQMDETMIRCLQVQVWEGKKIGNSFKESAYNFVAKEVNSKHPQHHKEVTKDNVVNRFRTIKQTFRNLLLCLEQSGFSFDHTEKKLKVEDQIWYPFAVKKGKEFMKLRNMTWPLFEELKEVVGEDHATGEFSQSNRDSFRQRKDKGTTSEEPRPYIHPVDHMEIGETDGGEDLNTQVPMSTSHSGEGSGASAPRERKRAKVALDGQISSVAASIDRLATVVQERHVSPKALLDAIQQVDGFSEDTLDIVFDFLMVNEPQAKAFLVRDVEQRRRWILRFLDQGH